jgi:hypothetical protein
MINLRCLGGLFRVEMIDRLPGNSQMSLIDYISNMRH